MTNTSVHPRVRVLFDEMLMAADEYITLPTARRLADELGFTDYDPQDYERTS